MQWLKGLSLNLVALSLAALLGAFVYGQAVYEYGLRLGAMPVATLIRGFLVSLVVAAVAPSTRFTIRLATFSGIYLADLALSVVGGSATVWLVDTFFGGDGNAAKPWTYGGAVIPVVTGVCAYFLLRHYRQSRKPVEDERD